MVAASSFACSRSARNVCSSVPEIGTQVSLTNPTGCLSMHTISRTGRPESVPARGRVKGHLHSTGARTNRGRDARATAETKGPRVAPEPWRPSPLLAAVVAFGVVGLVFGSNESLGLRWFGGAPYTIILLAQPASWLALRVLARVLDRSLDLALDLVLFCWRRFGAKSGRNELR